MSGISVVYNDDVMVFVQETGEGSLSLLGNCTHKPCFFTRPAESITLVIFFGKLFEAFCPFSFELTALFLLISRSILYILDKNPWSGIYVTNISSYSGGFYPLLS